MPPTKPRRTATEVQAAFIGNDGERLAIGQPCAGLGTAAAREGENLPLIPAAQPLEQPPLKAPQFLRRAGEQPAGLCEIVPLACSQRRSRPATSTSSSSPAA